MQLGEGDVQVGAAQQTEVDGVIAVQQVHLLYQVKHLRQLGPAIQQRDGQSWMVDYDVLSRNCIV